MLADMQKVERAARMSFMDFEADEKAVPVASRHIGLVIFAACSAVIVLSLALTSL